MRPDLGDVDLETGTLAVRKARVVSAYRVLDHDPKTEWSTRTIAIDQATVAVLRRIGACRHRLWAAGVITEALPVSPTFSLGQGSRETRPPLA